MIVVVILWYLILSYIMNWWPSSQSTTTTTTTTIQTTTIVITTILECDDSGDCPSEMKCENNVCVDVGCAEEGEGLPGAISTEHMATECCEGLIEILPSIYFDENCEPVYITGGPGPVCTKCGNGICGIEETKCNCPEDCE